MTGLFLAVMLSLSPPSHSDQPVLIGYVTLAFGAPPSVASMTKGLQDQGYKEYGDFLVGVRFTSGDASRLKSACEELIASGVSVLVTAGVKPTMAAAAVTSEIPIVFTTVFDPVGLGLVDSFAVPGGNVTGIASLDNELDANRLQKFSQLAPEMRTVLLPYNKNETHTDRRLEDIRKEAFRNNITLVERLIVDQPDAQAFLSSITSDTADGIINLEVSEFNLPGFVLQASQRLNIPTMFNGSDYVDLGGLASYGTSFHAVGDQAARLVGKILQGQHPANIPVEANRNIDFSINLGTVKKLGITVPPELLFQATRIVR